MLHSQQFDSTEVTSSWWREEEVWQESEAIRAGWPGCSAIKGSLRPGSRTCAHKLARRWETQELQRPESIYTPWLCAPVVQFSHSNQKPTAARTACFGCCFSKGAVKQRQNC